MIKLLITGFAVLAFLFVFLSVDRFRWHDFISGIWLATVGIGLMLLVLALSAHFGRANARDLGQWTNSDPVIHEWYESLMRPDAPSSSCCSIADAYYADEVHVRDGKTYTTITDDRPDEPLGRPHIDVGTVIEVPPEKLKWDRANPTGHGVIFVSKGLYTWCFVQASGI